MQDSVLPKTNVSGGFRAFVSVRFQSLDDSALRRQLMLDVK